MPTSRQSSSVRRWLAACMPLVLLAAMLVPATSVAAAEPTDMVLEWNINAIVTISNPAVPPVTTPPTPPGLGQGPPIAMVHLAMVHGAIYDAVNAIDGGHQPYLYHGSASATASKAAATAKAARDVLASIIPAGSPVLDSVNAMYASSLSRIPDNDDRAAGIAVGAAAAAAMIADRVGDGRTDVEPFPTTNEVGKWRLVPPGNANVQGFIATTKPFTLNGPGQYVTEGPPAISSDQYTIEYNEVKALGAKTGSSRTNEQTALAFFVSANPLPFMNRGLRDIATARAPGTVEQARLFAMTSMASADALIACWNSKFVWSLWRPQTAINEGDNDGNPDTVGDEHWESLFATPGYPENPSGYNCLTAGLMYGAKEFFGTEKISVDLTSPGTTPATTRHYDRLTDVVDDTIDGRIYTGFHFRSGDVQGAWLGKKAAQWGAKQFFGPAD